MISKNENGGSIIEPHDNDVLCWRSGKPTAHEGNALFYHKVQSHANGYSNARFNRERRAIVETIVAEFKRLEPPGRFLSRDGQNGPWYEISDEQAHDKASQALRLNSLTKKSKKQNSPQRIEENEGGDYFDDFMSGMVNQFMCPTCLDDIDEDFGESDVKEKNEGPPDMPFEFTYKPNEFGLPEGRDEPNLKLQKTFSYKPNEYGLRKGHEDEQPDIKLQKTYSYKPNQYGLKPGCEKPIDLKSPRSLRKQEVDIRMKKTFSYKPNEYGLRDPNEPRKPKSPESEYTDDFY